MKWIKKGLIYTTDGKHEWSKSHTALPAVGQIDGDRCRIYFTTRDVKNRSHTAWIDVDLSTDPWSVLARADKPILCPGSLGTFDDSGAMGSWLVSVNRSLYLYYTGWNLGVTVPFRFSIGLAVSDDGGLSFKKVSKGPLIDRNPVDPYLVASSCVLAGQDLWRMWYVSGARWEHTPQGPKHYYHIRYAWSSDGLNWVRDGKVCIDFANDMEYAFARPSVLVDRGRYQMWYSYRASTRGTTYRIGYAESGDSLSWERKDDEVGIDVSSDGWDSEMICYPFVFQHRGRTYMIHNGNGYGRSGFGYAVLED